MNQSTKAYDHSLKAHDMDNNLSSIIKMELAAYFNTRHLDISFADLSKLARQISNHLNDQLVSHVKAAGLMGIHPETLHRLRRAGFIQGIPKFPNPHAKRKHFLYRYSHILEVKNKRYSKTPDHE